MADVAGSNSVSLAAATSTTIMQPNKGRRLAFSISNAGSNVAYITMSNTENAAVVNYGIRLAAGGVISDSFSGDVPCWQGTVLGVSTAGTTISVWERVDL